VTAALVERVATVDHPGSAVPAAARMETAVQEDAAVSAVSVETAATAEQARADTLSASSACGPNAR
jgi:ABC-type Na+ efflux pump permease subunit